MQTPTIISHKDFESLPLDQQRTIIDWCIQNKATEMLFEGTLYQIPNIIQITYKCDNKNCNNVISARFFKSTVVEGNIKKNRRCPVPKCGGTMYISHKTASLDYKIGESKSKSAKTRIGLLKHFAPIIEEEIEQYGGVEENDE